MNLWMVGIIAFAVAVIAAVVATVETRPKSADDSGFLVISQHDTSGEKSVACPISSNGRCTAFPDSFDKMTWRFDRTEYSGLTPTFIFEKYDEDAVVAPMTNVRGEFYSIQFNYSDDMFAAGFAEGLENGFSIEPNTLLASRQNARIIVGDSAIGSRCDAPFTFSSNESSRYPLHVPQTLEALHGIRRQGAFRISFRTLDYQYSLVGKEFVVRVIISACGLGLIGDKMIRDSDGVFKFLNLDTGELTKVRSDNVLTFWNEPQSYESLSDLSPPIPTMSTGDMGMAEVYDAHNLGLPIDLVANDDVSKLTSTSKVNLSFHIDGAVSFRNAKSLGLSESDLARNLIHQLLMFDIVNMSFSGKLLVA